MPSRFDQVQEKGYIDVWWLYDDGGIILYVFVSLIKIIVCWYYHVHRTEFHYFDIMCSGLAILLPFLISRNKHWKHCKLRIFTPGSSRNIDQAKLRYTENHDCFKSQWAFILVLIIWDGFCCCTLPKEGWA